MNRRIEDQLEPDQLFQFWESPTFRRSWERLDLNSDDLLELQTEIMRGPTRAPVIRDTGGIRKLRFSPARLKRGKSGAFRICYVCFEEFGEVLLVLAFAKNEQENLTPGEKKGLRELVERQRAGYARRQRKGQSS